MSEHLYNSSDLNSVLRTLSTLTNPAVTSGDVLPKKAETHDPQRSRPGVTQLVQSGPISPAKKPAPKSATLDPSTIITWPAALRYVMTTVGQDEETQLRIRGLITSQHKHEKQWWKAREALLERQRARGDKKKELNAVLILATRRSIGAPVDSTMAPPLLTSEKDENADELELAEYDRKVYKASVTMANALISELRGMKIPFFVTQKSLIRQEDAPASSNEQTGDLLTNSDLSDLQRRMLGLLEDICKE
ncbi:hypothetical protein N7539_003030 [Penicillium diatomitis]|uniref:Uncharacterized protein n=1 Tax=Penicillium diatomitis TaxID=2819901 RepID=A0A9W9XGH0_9EURO|nr:uncharacterized protein N7539_003030 [Penicillium diatomitis]KAJ5491463.1 hypothetical protein N7539_003030 [Penicillium diatomitis]